jgi:four helix bundle protein
VAANLSKGFGKYHYKENKNFCDYSKGSLYETKTWLNKAHTRGLINDDKFRLIYQQLDDLGVKLNNYIKSIENAKNN